MELTRLATAPGCALAIEEVMGTAQVPEMDVRVDVSVNVAFRHACSTVSSAPPSIHASPPGNS